MAGGAPVRPARAAAVRHPGARGRRPDGRRHHAVRLPRRRRRGPAEPDVGAVRRGMADRRGARLGVAAGARAQRLGAGRVPPVAIRGATVALAVVAAHRTGQPLHPELVALGARRSAGWRVTAPAYRLDRAAGARGAARWDRRGRRRAGTSIEVELHELPTAALGALLCALPAAAGARAASQLVEGEVLGMVCASAPAEAVDISAWGSWPALPRGRGGRCRVRVA